MKFELPQVIFSKIFRAVVECGVLLSFGSKRK